MTGCGVFLQIMRETLIYLSHLDHEDTEQQVIRAGCGELSDIVVVSAVLGFLCYAYVPKVISKFLALVVCLK